MDAGVHTITDLLYAPGRLIIPVYQRPYVWTREQQWEPLWNDIVFMLDGFLEGKSRRHFLGAIVLQQLPNQPGELPRREVIDGQQRMTTLQLLLAACAASAGEMGAVGVRKILLQLVRNDEHLASGDEAHKLWPTEADQETYRALMNAAALQPPSTEVSGTGGLREAFGYFGAAAKEFAIADGVDAIVSRFEVLRNVLMQQLHVVSINLQEGDDPQLIFETLNARGTPLLEMDNVKNSLFHRARLQGFDVGALSDEVWQPELGQEYWRVEQRQGRLNRPRAELFLFHWLAMVTQDDVPATKLFQTFRAHVLEEAPGDDARALTELLTHDAKIMRSFDSADPASVMGRYFRALDGVDTSTVLPLTLILFRLKELEQPRRARALEAIESFLVRRMLMGYTTKRYNRLFVDLLPTVAAQPSEADDAILGGLSSSAASSAVWPSDHDLRAHLLTHPLYGWIARARIAYTLWELELVLRDTSKTEDIVTKPKKLSIEHVLPQQWEQNWPLADPTEENIAARGSLVNVLGNLTLVTGDLNSSMSNAAWSTKRKRLDQSVLLLNSDVKTVETWSEDQIRDRGQRLADLIVKRWPGPEAMIPNFDPAKLKSELNEISPTHQDLTAEQLKTIVSGASELFRPLLAHLASRPGEQLRFIDIETALGWSRGRLASVLGGYAVFAKSTVDGKRPYRLGQDEDGSFWMWMDPDRASAIGSQIHAGSSAAAPGS